MLVCDYLKFTFKASRLPFVIRDEIEKRLTARHSDEASYYVTEFDFFLEVFPEIKVHIDEFLVLESARFYKRRHCFNDACYIYDDDGYNGNRGVNVEFPSHGLYLIKEWFNFEDGSDVLLLFGSLLSRRGCTLSRLDVCVDIPTAECTVKPIDFLYWASNGQLKSHYRCFQACGNKSSDFVIKTLMGGAGGATFYLGSRRHQMLRVYDKSVESNGQNNSIRFEIETHREKANDILIQYLDHRFSFKDLLLNMLDIVAYYDENNRSRVRRDDKFEDFLNSCLTKYCSDDDMFIPVKRVPPSLEKRMEWVERIYNSILDLQYIDKGFRLKLQRLREVFEPSDYAVRMREYLSSLDIDTK